MQLTWLAIAGGFLFGTIIGRWTAQLEAKRRYLKLVREINQSLPQNVFVLMRESTRSPKAQA